MGFEYKSWMRPAAGAKAPPSLEESYRRWLRSMRDRFDSELAGEERAAEWLRTALPRLESNDHRKPCGHARRLIRRGDEMTEECKLQMLNDSVLDSMLRETKAEAGRRRIREERAERVRRIKCVASAGAMLSSFAALVVSGILIPTDDMTLSEVGDFLLLQVLLFFSFGVSGAVLSDNNPPHPARPTMKFCSGRPRVGLMELLPS